MVYKGGWQKSPFSKPLILRPRPPPPPRWDFQLICFLHFNAILDPFYPLLGHKKNLVVLDISAPPTRIDNGNGDFLPCLA